MTPSINPAPNNSRGFWLSQLNGNTPSLNFPVDFQKSKGKPFETAVCALGIDPEKAARISNVCSQVSVGMFDFLAASVKVLLFRYTQQEDISVWTVANPWNHEPGDSQSNPFQYLRVLSSHICPQDHVDEVLKLIHLTIQQALNTQEYPWDPIQDDISDNNADTSHPLFRVFLNLIQLADSPISPPQVEPEELGFDLSFIFEETKDGIKGQIRYNAQLFRESRIERMITHLNGLIDSILTLPQSPVAELSYLSKTEWNQIQTEFNPEVLPLPSTETIVGLFERQVMAFPQHTALSYKGKSWSYADLNAQSNQLAHHLLDGLKGIPNPLIGVMLEKSPEAIIALMGILKAGAAFVPIDPRAPKKRIEYVLNDTQVQILLTHSEFMFDLPGYEGELFVMDLQLPMLETGIDNPGVEVKEDHLAYALYTSGTTGNPKGVLIRHDNLLNYLIWAAGYYFTHRSDRVFPLFTPLSFDLTLTSIFTPLISGNCIKIYEEELSIDQVLFDIFDPKSDVSVVKLTPSHVDLLAHLSLTTTQIEVAILGGEALAQNQVNQLLALNPSMRIYNEYGPTETTIGCTVAHITHDIDIGKPIANTRVYVLDPQYKVCPVGIPGEICVGGAGVGMGYLNQPKLTREKFLHPEDHEMGEEVLYRTGDIGAWLPDGRLVLQGRKDNQVKIRGHRIELGEIEQVMRKFEGVHMASVYVAEDTSSQKRLCAAITPDPQQGFTLHSLLEGVGKPSLSKKDTYRLPNEMVIYHNNKSETDLIYYEIFEDLTYLKHGIRISEGDVIVDIGANIGLFSLFAGLHFPGVKIYSFEPIAPVHELLRANLDLYNLDAQAFNFGFADVETEAIFQYYPNSTVLSGRYGSEEEKLNVKTYIENQQTQDKLNLTELEIEELVEERVQSEEVKCQLKRLSDVMRELSIDQIDLLKIDVEKSERDVIRGIDAADWAKIKQVVIEIHDVGTTLQEVKGILEEEGFEVVVDQDAILTGTNIYNLYAQKPEMVSLALPQRKELEFNQKGQWTDSDALIRELRRHCGKYLPEYMIPSNYVVMDQLPLTQNGKVDVSQIHWHGQRLFQESERKEAPRNEVESVLLDIWKEVLEKDHISLTDNFFSLGGHSLLAIKVSSRVSKELGVKLDLKEIFDFPTISSLAKWINPQQSSPYKNLHPVEEQQYYALSHAQKRLWTLDQLKKDQAAYNIPFSYICKGLDEEVLQRALSETIARYESLRTTFVLIDGIIKQRVIPFEDFDSQIRYLDLRGTPRVEAEAERLARKESVLPFDLSEGPLIRTTLIQLTQEESLFLISLHHIISDGLSMTILVKEIIAIYNAIKNKKSHVSESLALQYKDYAAWENQKINESGANEAESFWLNQFSEGVPRLDLPSDYPRPAVKTFNGDRFRFHLPLEYCEKIALFSREYQATSFMVLYALTNVLLHKYSGNREIVLGMPVTQRSHEVLEKQIGFFVNTTLLKSLVNREESFSDLLIRTKEQFEKALNNQWYPYDLWVEKLNSRWDLSRMSLFDVVVTFSAEKEKFDSMVGVDVRPFISEASTSKLDLSIDFSEWDDGIWVRLVYNSDIFSARRISKFESHFKNLLLHALDSPDKAIETIHIYDPDEMRLVDIYKDVFSNSSQEIRLDEELFGQEKDLDVIGYFVEKLNQEFNIQLSHRDIRDYNTLNRLLNYIHQHKLLETQLTFPDFEF